MENNSELQEELENLSMNSSNDTNSTSSTLSSSNDRFHDPNFHFDGHLVQIIQDDFGLNQKKSPKVDGKKTKQNKTRKVKTHLYKGLIYCINKGIKKIPKSKKNSKIKNFKLLRVEPIFYTNPKKKLTELYLKDQSNTYLINQFLDNIIGIIETITEK